MESKVCSRSQGQPPGARSRAMMETARSKRSPVVLVIASNLNEPRACGQSSDSLTGTAMLLPYRRVSMQTCSSGTLSIQPRAGDGIQNSMNIPQKSRASLDGQRFQVVVIGGGINGVAIARECAR